MKIQLQLLAFAICFLTFAQSGHAQLSGTYTIGNTESNYHTLTEAITALSTSGINGDVTFNIADGTYNEAIEINSYDGNTDNIVTFQSASGDASKVKIEYTLTEDNGKTIILKNAKNIHFSDLTILHEGINGNAVWINESNNLEFSGCVLDNTNSCINLIHVDYFGEPCSNLVFRNNVFNRCYNALSIAGGYKGKNLKYVTITDNSFNNALNSDIELTYCENVVVTNNKFRTNGECNQFINSMAILLLSCPSFNVSANDIMVSYCHGIKIRGCNSNGTSKDVYNNFIAVKMKPGGKNIASLNILESSDINVFFNTIRVIGIENGYLNYNTSILSSSNINFVNNILNSNLSYNLLIDDPNSLQTSNHNCFNSKNPFHHIASDNQKNALSLSSWQQEANKDQNSLVMEPNFVSETDSHHNTPELRGKGISYGNVTTDIDNYTRETVPCIGASCIPKATNVTDIKRTNSVPFSVKEKQLIPIAKHIQSCSIYDLSGKQVYYYNQPISHAIVLNHLNNGMYIIRATIANQIVTQKIIIK